MSTVLTNLASAEPIGTSETVLITSVSDSVFIGKAVITNTSASPVTVTLYRLLDSETATAGSGGNWLTSKIIPSGVAWTVQELAGATLTASMKLSATASTGAVCIANISGNTTS